MFENICVKIVKQQSHLDAHAHAHDATSHLQTYSTFMLTRMCKLMLRYRGATNMYGDAV